MEKISKILFIKLDHIGDLILATPAFAAARKRYPDAQIDVMVNEKSQSVIKNSRYIDHVFLYNSRDFDRDDFIDSQGLGSNIQTIYQIRQQKYDVCIGLREDLSNIPIQLMCGAGLNYSFSTNTQFGTYLDHSVQNDETKHAADIHFDLLELLDIEKPENIVPDIVITEEDKEWAEEFLRQEEQGTVNARIGLSIGGGWFLNWWPVENYRELAGRIKNGCQNVSIVLVGGPAEKKLEERFAKEADFTYVSAVGRTNIGQLTALYEKMDFVVTNDGGPMHMATAAKTPVIALFGPSPYKRFGPLGKENVVICKKYPCSPCPQFVKGQTPRCKDNQCMKAITVDEVYQCVVSKLERLFK